jgi:hypothetical protein
MMGRKMDKPNCYKCINRVDLVYDAHSRCVEVGARVAGNPHGIKHGWFAWPFNYDPVWLVSCDSYRAKEE